MSDKIYLFDNYKEYLLDVIEESPASGRGLRTALAKAAGCQMAYMSQVLRGPAHLSLEQAERVSGFLGHSAAETHFFLLSLQQVRAGTSSLRQYFANQMNLLREERKSLKNRLHIQQPLSSDVQSTYYSHWTYAAVHIALCIPELQTVESIGKFLGLSLALVADVLRFLTSAGLAKKEGSVYKTTVERIHLGSDSPFVASHHSNWRTQAMYSLRQAGPKYFRTNLHYSSVVSLSKSDVDKVRDFLMQNIQETKARFRSSKDETLYCFSVDFYNLANRE